MQRLSIGRWITVALLGLTVALAALAALGVANLYSARQTYEDRLARTYQLQSTDAQLLVAGIARDSALQRNLGPSAQRAAGRSFADAAARTRALAAGDAPSSALVNAQLAALGRAAALARLAASNSGPAAAALARAEGAATTASGSLAARQDARRAGARAQARDDSRQALIVIAVAGLLALVGVLALVSALVGSLRRPLEALVDATAKLAAGQTDTRVPEAGPRELRELASSFNSMAGALQAAQERIESERRRLAVVVESLGDGLVVCDEELEIVLLNPRARVLLEELEVGGRANAGESPLPPVEQALAGDVGVLHGDRSLEVTAARLPGDLKGFVYTVRDATERVRLERAKDEFVATASHELRSPLTSIKGFIELLGETTELDERQREWVQIILLSTNRLNELVADLLDVARIDAGRIEVRPRPTDLSELTREAAALMTPRLTDKQQQLDVSIAADLPPAFVDPARMRQVLSNLLTNAHLYTDTGGSIQIAASAHDGQIQLEVRDTGRGMSREQLQHVFDRFYRAIDGAGSAGSGIPGTGLGLTIVRSLVELQGGRIGVTSELGEGTTFTLQLPAAEPVPHAPALALSGRRVLVVDDEPEIAGLIAAQLQPHGVQSVVVHDGQHALARLREEHFDAITLDVLMPGLSGFEVLRAIRSDPRLATMPVVVVSVFSGHRALSGEWVVAKPIDARELIDALGGAIMARRGRVLVAASREHERELAPTLEQLGLSYEWVSDPVAVLSACERERFEIALVDAGLPDPAAVLHALDLRGRRGRQAVIVFSTSEPSPGLAKLDAEAVPVEQAAEAIVTALAQHSGT